MLGLTEAADVAGRSASPRRRRRACARCSARCASRCILGWAAKNGLSAAFLAQAGLHQRGAAHRGQARLRQRACHRTRLRTRSPTISAQTWELLENTYKPFACGIVIHPVIDGCIQLRNASRSAILRDIEAIDVDVHPLVLELTGKTRPQVGLEGKFSVFHSAAVALIDGAAGEAQYSDARVRDPSVVALRDKVRATVDRALPEDAARIRIRLRDGRVLAVDRRACDRQPRAADDRCGPRAQVPRPRRSRVRRPRRRTRSSRNCGRSTRCRTSARSRRRRSRHDERGGAHIEPRCAALRSSVSVAARPVTERTGEIAMDRRQFVRAGLGAGAIVVVRSAGAQAAWPSHSIRIIAPVQPGGGVDLVARTVGERISKGLGQPIVVENQSGGGGVVASQAVARAAPDGYTLMVGYVGTHGTNPAVRKLPYDAVRTSRRSPWSAARRTCSSSRRRCPRPALAEFVQYAKANAGKLSYGSSGPGTLTHLAMEQFKVDDGHGPRAHRLSRHRTGVHRHPGRSHAGDDARPRRGVAAHQGGQAASAGGDRQGAPSAAARRADVRGAWAIATSTACSGTASSARANLPAEIVRRLNDEINARARDRRSCASGCRRRRSSPCR